MMSKLTPEIIAQLKFDSNNSRHIMTIEPIIVRALISRIEELEKQLESAEFRCSTVSTFMNKEILSQLKEASAKATKRPWVTLNNGGVLCAEDFIPQIAVNFRQKDDLKFIALARNHIDALIETIETQENCIEDNFVKWETEKAENAKMREALEHKTKRSSYRWSENGPYTSGDIHNEGSIECARECLVSLEKK